MTPKLFKVTCRECGWDWSETAWTKYFLCYNQSTVEAYIEHTYGSLDKYGYDEEETHITIKEVEVILL